MTFFVPLNVITPIQERKKLHTRKSRKITAIKTNDTTLIIPHMNRIVAKTARLNSASKFKICDIS